LFLLKARLTSFCPFLPETKFIIRHSERITLASYAYSVYNSTSVTSISKVSFIIAQSRRNLYRVITRQTELLRNNLVRNHTFIADAHASLINSHFQSTIRTDTKSIALASLSICLTKEGSQRRMSRGTNDAT